MKTILYNPIFINPLAYYVFPRLTRYLQPDNESTAEPANYIGTIEVKVIAYGDTTLKRTYTNTDSIDLSEFKNTWIRISLFTKVGSCVLGEWKIGNMESDLPYIDPEVLASLKAVVIVGNKTNNDSDRAIVKNLVDPDNPFVISNAAYEGMSGYNGYPIILSGTNSTYQDKASYTNIVGDDKNIINITRISFNTAAIFSYIKQNGTLTDYNRNIESFKVKVTGIDYSKFVIKYSYISGTNATERTVISITSDGTYELPKSFASDGSLTSDNVWIGLNFTKQSTDIPDIIEDVNVTIEVLPEFEGAFVTDGIDDLITSTKTVQEMGITDEVTVVSMIHQIDLNSTYTIATTNYIENSNSREHVRSDVYNYGKTGIYGYSASLINNTKSDIKNILGDEADYYVKSTNSLQTIFDAKFSVVGRISELTEVSQVAWYWTIIANKVLTTDQINQVIAYFNLDRTLKPDILCDVKKQGITNENHAEFGDKLIDFSGNGRDIQLNNLAWKGGSGIAAKQYETFKDWTNTPYQTSTVTEIDEFTRVVDSTSNAYWVSMINRTSDFDKVHDSINIVLYQDDMLLVHECKYKIDENVTTKALYETLKSGVNTITLATIDKFTDIPEDAEIMSLGEWVNPKSNKGSVKITLLPSYEGGVLLDGINDFGKVTGMPIYKDYTFISKYQRLSYREAIETEGGAVIASKSYSRNQGAFIFNGVRGDYAHDCYSFGLPSSNNLINDKNLEVYYQTKYTNQGKSISSGTAADSDILWLGTVRDNDNRFINAAIYSLMSFPYSMSEFLIERQLKKHKLGTLYPDMVEFRPIVKSNSEYKVVDCYIDTLPAVVGNYYPINSKLRIAVSTKGAADEVTSLTVNGVSLGTPSVNGNRFTFNGTLSDKSPQKINITIDEYIRYEDIVQPYPVLLRFNDENGNEVSWGGKFRVGSTITRIGSIADPESNLLNGLYSVSGLSLNGKAVTSSTSIVEKQMVFKTTTTWLLDNNEPNCILSPRLLRMPNSSYKILGHIPDISGHGNHGVIHNSAYAEGSGVNEDGSYQFDGVDDFVTIPTVTGGKQVLMKVNWQSSIAQAMLYDQRGTAFAIWNSDKFNDNEVDTVPAYSARNGGNTYIDGILNKNILASQLRNITHNIVSTNNMVNENSVSPNIGCALSNSYYSQMSLYDFMLFDNISTDDKIKELNEYVGIEGNTE